MKARIREVLDVAHEVHPLAIDVGAPFDEFRTRYEQAVPPVDAPTYERLKKENADGKTVPRVTAQNAPHGFMISTYDSPAIAEVGQPLDRLLAELCTAMGEQLDV
jgi:hypothetical protein